MRVSVPADNPTERLRNIYLPTNLQGAKLLVLTKQYRPIKLQYFNLNSYLLLVMLSNFLDAVTLFEFYYSRSTRRTTARRQ
jgi:hypothetical protein